MIEHLIQPTCILALVLIALAIILCFLRMAKGPTLPDRVMTLDLIANLCISFIATYSIFTDQPVFIDVIIALALIIFLTTVAFAQLIGTIKYRTRKK